MPASAREEEDVDKACKQIKGLMVKENSRDNAGILPMMPINSRLTRREECWNVRSFKDLIKQVKHMSYMTGLGN